MTPDQWFDLLSQFSEVLVPAAGALLAECIRATAESRRESRTKRDDDDPDHAES